MPRPQFTLRALLVAMLVMGVAADWLAQWRQVASARRGFANALATASERWWDVQAIERLRKALSAATDAESKLPFVGMKTVRRWHLERLKKTDFGLISYEGPVDDRALEAWYELSEEQDAVEAELDLEG